jgi:hypothetical protein
MVSESAHFQEASQSQLCDAIAGEGLNPLRAGRTRSKRKRGAACRICTGAGAFTHLDAQGQELALEPSQVRQGLGGQQLVEACRDLDNHPTRGKFGDETADAVIATAARAAGSPPPEKSGALADWVRTIVRDAGLPPGPSERVSVATSALGKLRRGVITRPEFHAVMKGDRTWTSQAKAKSRVTLGGRRRPRSRRTRHRRRQPRRQRTRRPGRQRTRRSRRQRTRRSRRQRTRRTRRQRTRRRQRHRSRGSSRR